MNKTVLIAGPPSSFLRELVGGFLGNEYRVAVALPPGADFPSTANEEDRLVRLVWNRRSPLSARVLLLEYAQRLGPLRNAIVVHSAGRENQMFHELLTGYIEEKIDGMVKGYLFLVREIMSTFRKSRSGTLAIAMQDEDGELLSPLDGCVSGAIGSLASALFTAYREDPIITVGFRSTSHRSTEFANFLMKRFETLDSNASGQWFTFAERSSFIRSLPLGFRKKS